MTARAHETCRAIGCIEQVARGQLLCRRHWRLLPGEMRLALGRTRGRKVNGRAAERRLRLIANAINAVAEADRTGTRGW
ncbi:MAG TPA: hypothetical protein ENK05_11630 [Gammaproteobacteria bacterium]|nr:hypothetical protein [Gammaproteobacteria bacterium]